MTGEGIAPIDAGRRKEALRALVNLALLEGILLFLVIAFYLYTGEVIHLIVGVAATSVIFGPLLRRWVRDHARALKTPPADPNRP